MDEFKKGFDPTDEYESIDNVNFYPDKKADNGVSPDIDNADNAQTANQTISDSENPAPKKEATSPAFEHGKPYKAPPINNIPTGYPNYAPYQQPVYPPYSQPYIPPQNAQPPMYAPVPPQYPPYVYPNPYQPAPVNTPYAMKQDKGSSIGIKIFIGIMTALLVFFAFYFVSIINKDDNHPLSQKSMASDKTEIPTLSGEYIESTIVLQEDKGQFYTDSDNIYPPDSSAKKLKAKGLPDDKDDKKYTTENVYDSVKDSVVSITCYESEITGKPEDVIGRGTGTIVSSDGYIVTNSHVISDSTELGINVKLANSKEYKAKVVGIDSRTDIAVIKIDAKDLKAATFGNSDKVNIGQDSIAIGNPGGEEYQNSLTKGVVSGLDVELSLSKSVKYIQLDAAINPGNSGGPLCNIYGQVVGINTAKISDVVYEGMGFAIPSNKIIEIANDLIHKGYVDGRVRIGITGREVSNQTALAYNIPYGIIVDSIDKDGPLGDSVVKKYDIITEINGTKVESFQDIYAELEKHEDGDEVSITIFAIDT